MKVLILFAILAVAVWGFPAEEDIKIAPVNAEVLEAQDYISSPPEIEDDGLEPAESARYGYGRGGWGRGGHHGYGGYGGYGGHGYGGYGHGGYGHRWGGRGHYGR